LEIKIPIIFITQNKNITNQNVFIGLSSAPKRAHVLRDQVVLFVSPF